MSWIGGLNDSFNQLSSLTGELGGRLSNFTREVLTEDADDETGTGDEIVSGNLQQQLKHNEALISNLKQENLLLQEKVHKAELLVSTSGIEYEARLQQKTKEITQLKHKLSHHGDAANGGFGGPILSSSFSNVSLTDDDDDFHDIINYQREINRLSQELEEANKKVEKWKLKANALKSDALAGNAGHNTDLALTSKIRELEESLQRESDHHQQEIRSMQDAHSAQINKYQEEVRKLKRNATDSPVLDGSSDNAISQNNRELESELNSLKEQSRTRNRQLQMQKKQIDDLTSSLKTSQQELEKVKETNNALLKEREEEKSHFQLEIDTKEKNLKDIESCLSVLAAKTGFSVNRENLKKSLEKLGEHYLDLKNENSETKRKSTQKEVEIEQLKNKIIEFEREKEERDNQENETEEELAESDQWPQDGIYQVAEEDQNIEQADAESDQHRRNHLPAHINFGSPLSHSSPQVFSARRRLREDTPSNISTQNPGDLTLTLQALQKQVEDYELEIEQYEQVQSEWQTEKQSLQELLNRYQNEVAQPEGQVETSEPENERAVMVEKLRKELKDLSEARGALEKETNRLQQEKDQLQVATKNLEEELNASICEVQSEKGQADALKIQLEKNESEKDKLQAAYDVLTQELDKSREEKNDLDQALDALDSQHQDEMTQLLTVRDHLKQQLKSTQNQLEEESTTKEELTRRLDDMTHDVSQRSDEEIAMLNQKLSVAEKENETLKQNLKEIKDNYEKIKVAFDDVTKEKGTVDEKVLALERDLSERILKVSELSKNLDDAKSASIRIQEDADKNCQDSVEKLTLKHQDEIKKMNFEFERVLKIKDEMTKEIDSLKKEEEVLQNRDDEKKLENELEEKYSAEITRLNEEIESLGSELENAGKEIAKIQSYHDEEKRRMLHENQEEIHKLEEDSRIKIQNLKEDQESYMEERDATDKVYTEKITHLEKLNVNLQTELQENRVKDDMASSKSSMEHKEIIEKLEKQYLGVSEQYSILENEHKELKSRMASEKIQFENQIKHERDEKLLSQKEGSELKNILRQATDAETALNSELSALKTELEHAKSEITNLSQKLSEKETLSSKKDDTYSVNEYESRIKSLLSEIENLKKNIETGDKNESKKSFEEILSDIQSQDIADLEKSDLSKDDIGSLLKLIKERDEVIEVLSHRQVSSVEMTKFTSEINRLEDANRSLSVEKDQILAVISEKTRENKKLKDEAHKMMGIVAENNAALGKVQQENAALLAKYEGYDKEMTKEAVGKLSRLVQEKELEIESLKQKCGTLLEVLQQQPGGGGAPVENAVSGQQVQSLIRDKETLMGQVQQLLNERNHLVALLNQRQSEVEEARTEISKASEALERDSDNNSKLQIGYSNLVHDYEQTQLKLASVMRELAPLKDKMSQLENLKETLLKKLNTDGHNFPSKIVTESLQTTSTNDRASPALQNGDLSEISLLREQLLEKDSMVRKANQESAQREYEVKQLLNDLKEKDLLIHSRTEKMTKFKKDFDAKTNEVDILRRSVENLRDQVSSLSKNSEESRSEVKNYSSRLTEKESESQAFQETNAQLSMLLKEKEYELENANDKCKRFESMAKENQEGQDTEAQRMMVELDTAKQTLIATRHERDQVMLSLKQRKLEANKYSEEARNLREKEAKLESELARLRNHLIQVEEGYTQEAVLAEDRENSLKEQLLKIQSTNSAVREATEQSIQQAESLQEQLRTAIGQRDQAIQQSQYAQEQGMQYATALQKLQVAVERMQREEAANFAERFDKVKTQLEQRNNDANNYESMVNELKAKLENSNEALKSASRLNQQLELKEENIALLKNIVSEKQLQLDDLHDKLHFAATRSEGMVDKEIMKNLVIGYFTSPGNKRPDILRLITGVLGFSDDETHKMQAGDQHGGARAWIGGWLWRGGNQGRPSASVPTSPRGAAALNESFSQMFVKFLENESVPHQAARLPAASMISEAQQKMNQRRAPRSPGLSSVPTPVGNTFTDRTGPSVAGRYSPYLLSASAPNTPQRSGAVTTMGQGVTLHPITPILPTFAPIINPKPAAEQEILQDILLSKTDR